MSDSYGILNAFFLKGESQLDLLGGCKVRLLILGVLSDEQIYLSDR